jgi:outer membrane protein insertion porin family
MFAKQTLTSASLVCTLLGLLAPTALAEPEPPARADGEAAPDDRPTGRFSVGAGYRTDDGFIASTEVAQDDLFGTGNALSLRATVSERRQLFLTRFVDPHLLGSQLTLTADLYADTKQLPGLWRTGSGASLELSAPVGDHLRAFVGYRFEAVRATREHPYRIASGGAAPDDHLLGAVRAGMIYDSRDALYAPRRGSLLGTSLEVADPSLGADVRLRRIEVWGEHHAPIGPLTLHVGGRLSSVASDTAAGVPASERLYLDGSSDVRGYAPGAIAPLGGFAKAVGSAELEVPIIPKWGVSAVGFVDGAAIFDATQGHVGTSAGAGLLWRSPLGPLRVDYAVPLDGGAPRWVLGLGGAF